MFNSESGTKKEKIERSVHNPLLCNMFVVTSTKTCHSTYIYCLNVCLFLYTQSKSTAVTGLMCTTPCVCKHAIPSINRRLIWDTTAYFQLEILTLGCGNEVIEMELTKQLPLKCLPINYDWDNKKSHDLHYFFN